MGDTNTRARRNWRHMLECSTDPAALVEYETLQLVNMLLGDTPLDTAAVHTVGLVWELLDIVVSEREAFAGAVAAVERTFSGFLEFLVRCHNTRPNHLLREVESRVVTMLYNLGASTEASGATHEQVAPFVPFLLHAAFVQLRGLRAAAAPKIFAAPPKKLTEGDFLSETDQYIWLCAALLSHANPAYFAQLFGFVKAGEDNQLQLAFIYELFEHSVFFLNRLFEALFAAPLSIKYPGKRGCAEPKVLPGRVLSFLSLSDTTTDLIPPAYYSSEGEEDLKWSFDHAASDHHAGILLHRMEILHRILPLGDALGTADEAVVMKVVTLEIKFIVGCLHWLLVTLVSCIHTMLPLPDGSQIIPLWRRSVVVLAAVVTDFSKHWLKVGETGVLVTQLFKGCLEVIALDQAFAAYHPQGSLDVHPVDFRGIVLDEFAEQASQCAGPLLHLLSKAYNEPLYSAFSAGREGGGSATGTRPALEMCIATFLHSLFVTHLDIAQWTATDLGAQGHAFAAGKKRAAAAVPLQNVFRGVHDVLSSISGTTVWHEMAAPRSTRASLAPNWLRATEIAKAFAALPFADSVPAGAVERVSQNAWTLVHYYFQLSIPCAPTAPPSQITTIRPGRGWDDYEEYFRDLDATASSANLSPSVGFPQEFGQSDKPGSPGYRLTQLLSSHLRGILTVIPYFRILFVVNKREHNLEQCAYYCTSLADLISFSAHNHGVAVPFLRTSLECFVALESPQALTMADRLEKIFLALMDLPSASVVQKYGTYLAFKFPGASQSLSPHQILAPKRFTRS
ncbi:hypothetical protein DIPPA_23945 [Diplonema papillatum]|nr:hypothetical protein DIPPA_23945 [Diplonema papillatum]